MSATGYAVEHLPPGEAADEILGLIRIGEKFRASQRRGRKHGVLRRHISELVARAKPDNFDALLLLLELEALNHTLAGDGVIVRVNRGFECLRYLEGGDEREVSFKRLRNIAQFRNSRESLTRETDE